MGGLGRVAQSAGLCTQDCGFDVFDDERQYAAKNFHRMDVSRNISTSVSADLGCLACTDPHLVGGKFLVACPRFLSYRIRHSLQFYQQLMAIALL